MASFLACVFLAVVVANSEVLAQNSTCTGSDAACLKALREYLTRTDWWFGDPYKSMCPDGSQDKSLPCMNPDTVHKSIISRIFQTTNYDLSNITQVLRIRFNSPAGSYRACDHKFEVPPIYMDQDINFTQVTYVDSWVTQRRPAIIWDAEPGAVYTLVAYHVDYLMLSGMWVNIQGGDSALGQELFPYEGPMAALNRTSFHAFLLYRQTGVIQEQQFDVIREKIEDFARGHGDMYMLNNLSAVVSQIDKPFGLGLISVGADPHGIEEYKSMTLHNNCPWLIARMRPMLRTVVDVHNLTALGADISNLELEVDIRYSSEAIRYSACCMNKSESARIVNVDPLSLTPISPVYLRSQPFLRLTAVNMLDTMFFFDKLYTLLLLDVTWATSSPGSRQTSLLWHVTDIQGNYATGGLTRKAYTMPVPPVDRSSNSLYTFFVFRQNATIGNYSMDKYCTSTGASVCNFNLYNFVLDYKLQLSGVNWFWSQPDLYSRMKLYETSASSMDVACKGISGYGQPCPDQCAATTTKSPGKATDKPGNATIRISTNSAFVILVSTFLVWIHMTV